MGGWLAGPVQCCGCGHAWIAVRPVGADPVECPACRRPLGITKMVTPRAATMSVGAAPVWTRKGKP